jgi:lipocalin
MNKSTLVLVYSVAFILGKVKLQVSHLGGCPTVRSLEGFNIEDFSGKWYEIMRYSSIFIKGKCNTFDVTLVSERNVSMTLSQKVNNEFANVTQYGVIESSAVWLFTLKTFASKLKLFTL